MPSFNLSSNAVCVKKIYAAHFLKLLHTFNREQAAVPAFSGAWRELPASFFALKH